MCVKAAGPTGGAGNWKRRIADVGGADLKGLSPERNSKRIARQALGKVATLEYGVR